MNNQSETMDIYTPRGSKVIMNDPTAGYPRDAKTIQDNRLIKGAEYTVQYTDVRGYHTYLYLVEYPGVAFNTVNFCNVPNGELCEGGPQSVKSSETRTRHSQQ